MTLATKPTPRCSEGKTYWTGCRCDFCKHTAARLKAETRYRRMQRDRGVMYDLDIIDSAECRREIRAAKRRGLSYSEISRLSEVPLLTIRKIGDGTRKKSRRATVNAIIRALAEPDVRAALPNSLVDGKWTRQMVKSLSAQGWSTSHQADIILNNRGHRAGFIRSLAARPTAKYVLKSSEDEMRWLVRAIGDKIGPSNISMVKMQKKGIFPTKHYDGVGNLIRGSLSPEQKAVYDSVR